jgi:type I restriction enzyme, R subunit
MTTPEARARTNAQLKELAYRIAQPPLSLTTKALWWAYTQLEQGKVRGAGAKRVLADLVALVRHAVQLDEELAPYPEQVQARYQRWLAQQEADNRSFTTEQRWWLDQIAAHIGVNLSVAPDDLAYGDFFNRGGAIAAARVFGPEWLIVLDELNGALAA